ncbi:hypothetical protein GCM10027184_76120 [Saccharothrix stipae]
MAAASRAAPAVVTAANSAAASATAPVSWTMRGKRNLPLLLSLVIPETPGAVAERFSWSRDR